MSKISDKGKKTMSNAQITGPTISNELYGTLFIMMMMIIIIIIIIILHTFSLFSIHRFVIIVFGKIYLWEHNPNYIQ